MENKKIKFSFQSFAILTIILFSGSITYGQDESDENLDENQTLDIESINVEMLGDKAYEAVVTGRYDEAMLYINQVLEIEPQNVDALNNKGFVLAELGKHEAAISYLDQVLEIEPQNVDALNNKGVAFIELERYEDAIIVMRQILQIDPENNVAYENKMIAFDHIEMTVTKNSEFDAFVQVQVRNSAGNLVSFVESDKTWFLPHLITYEFLELIPVVETIVRDGQTYESRVIMTIHNAERTGFAGTSYLVVYDDENDEEPISIFEAMMHGYIVEPGDTMLERWEILHLIND